MLKAPLVNKSPPETVMFAPQIIICIGGYRMEAGKRKSKFKKLKPCLSYYGFSL